MSPKCFHTITYKIWDMSNICWQMGKSAYMVEAVSAGTPNYSSPSTPVTHHDSLYTGKWIHSHGCRIHYWRKASSICLVLHANMSSISFTNVSSWELLESYIFLNIFFHHLVRNTGRHFDEVSWIFVIR